MKKKYPFIKQEGPKDCGVASILMLIKYYNGSIPIEELRDNLGWTNAGTITPASATASGNNVPLWVYQNFGDGVNSVNGYWTMTPHQDYSSTVWIVYRDGYLGSDYDHEGHVGSYIFGVRPVINLLKSSI